MTKLRDEHHRFAARLWRAGAATSEIAERIEWEFGIKVHRQAIQKLASLNRAQFPHRARSQKRKIISRRMRGVKYNQEDWG